MCSFEYILVLSYQSIPSKKYLEAFLMLKLCAIVPAIPTLLKSAFFNSLVELKPLTFPISHPACKVPATGVTTNR